jgi:ubiquinone/menaquinone biosynthesis C-methylase UbiE
MTNSEPHHISETYGRTQMGAPLSSRTAEHHADFFLPYLSAGMRLLDIGCGTASITAGLGRRVAPAISVGLDISMTRLRQARELGARRPDGRSTISLPRLVAADAYALPFSHGSFDAAYSHALLQHLGEPLRALGEIRRVLRPGGVVGVCDWDLDASLLYPTSALLAHSLSLFTQVRRRAGGSPDVGRRLGELLGAAGFERSEMSVRADGLASSHSGRAVGEYWATYFEHEGNVAEIAGWGMSDRDELQQIAHAWRAWGQQWGAIWITHWFYAAAFR